jgi:hypothetical protein
MRPLGTSGFQATAGVQPVFVTSGSQPIGASRGRRAPASPTTKGVKPKATPLHLSKPVMLLVAGIIALAFFEKV